MATDLEQRVLVLARYGRDAEVMAQLLGAKGLMPRVCVSLDDLTEQIAEGAACAVVTIEALAGAREKLVAALAAQPPWSDFPMIVLTAGPLARASSVEWLGKVFVLDRPVTVEALATTVRSAVRARSRQYEARAAIELRDQFLAMLGHELRNPLAAIRLASDTPASALTPEQMAHRMAIVQRQSRHLARLVDDLLDVARVTSGKIALRKSPVDVVDVVSTCVSSLGDFARDRAVEISFAPPSPIWLEADPTRLSQIIDNLVTNAIKYTPRGGHIHVRVEATSDACSIVVRDDGIGLAPEMLPRIFQLFAQVDAGLDRTNGGMGVGLALVKRLVELHGGTIEARSEGVGRGSEFVVTLPGVTEPANAGLASDAIAARGEGLRVVVVDDNDDMRELVGETFEALGCVVESAADGAAGLEQILQVRPDLAVIDIGLPELNGFELAEAVRAELGRGPYLVAVTGYGQASDRARSLAAGFDQHLTKPIRASAFGEMIAAARR